MSLNNKECKCEDWKENMPILDSAIIMAINHGGKGLKKSGNFCPYCGKPLTIIINDVIGRKHDG